jgi:hypothetical protein
MSKKELQEQLVASMKSWQRIENQSIAGTGKVLEKTDNPVVRLVMEIIQHDSMMHHRVQKMIVDSLEHQAISLAPEELAGVWTMIEEHIALEKQTVDFASAAIKALSGQHMVVQEYLLHYLLADEAKHDKLLEDLSTIKTGLYPYGS